MMFVGLNSSDLCWAIRTEKLCHIQINRFMRASIRQRAKENSKIFCYAASSCTCASLRADMANAIIKTNSGE